MEAHNRMKAYENYGLRAFIFELGDQYFLRVSRMKGVRRLERKRNLRPIYI